MCADCLFKKDEPKPDGFIAHVCVSEELKRLLKNGGKAYENFLDIAQIESLSTAEEGVEIVWSGDFRCAFYVRKDEGLAEGASA